MTEEEFLRLPDDGRKWELVDGEPKEVPTEFDHDLIKTLILSRILPIAMPHGYLTLGEAGVRMHNRNVRVPDISYTSKARIGVVRPVRGFGAAAPDLCIEIISPSEDKRDMRRKPNEYFDSGATLVWQLFPETRTVKVFTSPAAVTEFGPDDTLNGGDLLPGFSCRVGELFDTGLE